MIIDNHKQENLSIVKYRDFAYTDRFSSLKSKEHVEEVSRSAVSMNDVNSGLKIILDDAPQIADWQRLAKYNAWLSLVPFYSPDADWHTQSGEKVRPETYVWLTDQMLGRELRWRAAVEKKLLSDDFQTAQAKALILACGSGYQPILSAYDNKTKKPELTMLDFNANAIKHAKNLAKKYGVKADFFVRDALHVKDFSHDNFGSIAARVMSTKRPTPISLRNIKKNFSSVTMIGLSMYLPDDNFPYMIEKQKKLRSNTNLKLKIEVEKRGLKQMIQTMWNHTASGGHISFDIIQQPDFSTENGNRADLQNRVIELMGWPSFKLRSIEHTIEIIDELSINPRSIDIYRSPEDFFAIFKLKKP